ncbi:hypothetical protein [Nocardioides ultimimeridianus]
MSRRPAVRIEPRPEESVPSMVTRLARALGVTQRSLLPAGHGGLYFSNPGWWLPEVVDLLGIAAEQLRDHTLDGRLGNQLTVAAPSVMLRAGRWLTCPTCATGTYWTALVLVSSCSTCRVLLTPQVRPDRARRPRPVAAPPEALALQAAYIQLLTSQVAGGAAADDDGGELRRRFERVIRLLRFWRRAHRPSAAGPTALDSPVAGAEFATSAWPASATDDTTVAFIAETMRRRLPDAEGPRPADHTAARRALHRELLAAGITDRHIPTYLLPDKRLAHAMPYDLDIGLAASRALRREAAHAHCGVPPAGHVLDGRRGSVDGRHETLTLDRHLESTPIGIGTLTRLAHQLASGGAIDYVERAATLATLRRVPNPVLAQCPTRLDPELAAAWIRIELSGHPPRERWLLRDIADFDQTLRPEDRLILIEHGTQVVSVVADDVARATRSVRATPEYEFARAGGVS